MLKNRMNLSIVLIYGAIMIFITILQVILLSVFPEILANDSLFTTFNSISNLVLYSLIFMFFIIVFKKYLKDQLLDLWKNRFRVINILVIGFLMMVAASILSSMILEALDVTETSDNQEALNMLVNGSLFDKISLFVFAVLLAPFVEEIVFRKAVLNIFHFKYNADGSKKAKIKKVIFASIAILISSLVFGLIHVTSGDFVQIIYYAFLGIILGLLYLVSNKNIYVPIIVHLLINLMVTSIMLFEY